jgi:hypothetical protein
MAQYKQLKSAYIFALLFSLTACGQSGDSSTSITEESYNQKVISVEETELSQPTTFLKADGNYNKNLIGTKIKLHGTITNSASVATFKDAVVQITFYSATQTELFNKNYTIYNYFPPHSTVEFELKTENYKDVESIGVAVVGAKAK